MKSVFTLVFVCLLGQFGLMANPSNNLLAPSKFIKTLIPPPENCDSISANYSLSAPSLFVGDTIVFTNLSQYYTNSKWYLNDTLISYDTHLSWIFVNGGAQEIRLEVEDTLLQCFALYSAALVIVSPIDTNPNVPIPVDDCPLFGCNHVAGFDIWMPGCQSYANFGNIANAPNACGSLSCWRAAIGSPDYVVDSQFAASLTPGNSAGPLTNGQFCITSNPPVNPGSLKFAFHNPNQNAPLFGSSEPDDPSPGVTGTANFYMEAPVTAVNIQSGQEYIVSYYRAFTKGLNNNNNENILNNCGGNIANDYNNAALGSGLMFCNTPQSDFGASANEQFTNFQDALANPGDRLVLEQPAVNDQEWRQVIEVINTNINYNRLVFYGFHNLPVLQTTGGQLWNRYGWMFLDQVEIVRSNCPIEQEFIACGEFVTIGESCPVTNMVYEWYMTDANGNIVGLPFSTAPTITVSPTTTITYALIRRIAQLGEPGNNGYFVDNINAFNQTCFITVNVEPSTDIIPAFDINATICQNVQFTLPTTSLNGISGTWVPAFSSANLGTTSHTFLPDVICTSPVSITISVVPCGDCDIIPWLQLSGIINQDLPPGNYRIVGNITIQGDVNIQNCVFAIDPNKTITIGSDDALSLVGSHLYGCHALWNGIVVEPEGRLYTYNSFFPLLTTLIEDAKVAIDVLPYTAEYPMNRLRIHHTTFNKNLTGIRMQGYPYQNPDVVFNLYGNLFTCRVLTANPNVWPTTSVVIAPNPAGINNFNNPRINEMQFPNANLLPTMSNSGALSSNNFSLITGLFLQNVGTSFGSSMYPITIGGQQDVAPFVFDRMTRGIHAFRSNVDVYHAYFQANQYNVDGVSGVFADGAQDATIFYSGRINIDAQFNPVQFFNLQTAVNVRDYTQLITNNTTIRSNRTTANAPSGQIGILYSTRFLGRFHAIANQITNVNTGISGSLGRQGTIAIVDLQIIGNNIRRNIPNGPTGLIFNRGIFIERHPSANTGFAGIFDISNNTIFDVRHGISMFNTTAGNIQINNNNVTMNEVPGTPLNGVTPRYWGIRLDNVNSNLNNTNPRIQENIITGFNATNIQIRAIMLRNSNTFLIRCNNLLNSGAGFYFSGNCPMRLRQNTMRLHHFGLWLDNNATINQQGDVNLPTDNVWSNGPNNSTPWDVYGGIAPIGNGTTRIKTYVSNGTNAILSPMFVRTLATHNPNDSWASAGFGNFEYSIAQSSIFLTGGNIPSPCNVVLIDEPEGEEISYETHLMLMEQNTTMLDTIIMEAPDEIIRELVTYEYLDIQPEVKDSSEVLQEFYDIRNVQNIGILREMDKKIEEQDYQAAESLRDMVQANNLVELAYKAVLDLTLRYETGQFNAQDSLELVDWAQSCSEIYGKATFMAQALYNLVYRTSHMFQEDCPIIIPKNILLNQNPSHELSIVLYPNPNSSVLYAECNDSEIRNAQCVIRDLNGQIL